MYTPYPPSSLLLSAPARYTQSKFQSLSMARLLLAKLQKALPKLCN